MNPSGWGGRGDVLRRDQTDDPPGQPARNRVVVPLLCYKQFEGSYAGIHRSQVPAWAFTDSRVTAHSGQLAIAHSRWREQRDADERAGRPGHLGDVLVFAVPLLLPIQFATGGQLYLSEVVLLLGLPLLLDHARRRGVSRISHSIIALGLVWLLGLVLADIFRGTPFHDYSRGWANVAFLLLNFAALSLLIDGTWRRVTLFTAGLGIGGILQFYINPDNFAAAEPWKFGYGGPVTLLGVLFASRAAVYRRPVAASAVVIALGVINLRMDFRSLAGICFLTALIILLAARAKHLRRLDLHSVGSVTVLVASALAGFVIVYGYEYSARHGLLGAKAQEKYESQRSNFGILLSGRPQIMAAMHAIADSPIVGHGSWAKDPKYAAELRHELRKAGYRGNTRPPSQDLIPSHSHVLGAWVGAGILGPILWLWTLAVAASVLLRLHHVRDGRLVLVGFLGISFVWDVLFSPLGAGQRLSTAFYLVVIMLARQDLARATDSWWQRRPRRRPD